VKEKIKKILPWVLYPLFYLIALFFFALVTFPFDKAKEQAVSKFNAKARTAANPQELQIKEMSGHWLTGVKMKDVRLVSLSNDPTKPASELRIEEATVSLSLFRYIVGFGTQHVSYDVKAFGGEAEGTYTNTGKERSVDVTLTDIDMGQVEPLVAAIGLPVEGKLSGTVKLSMPEGKASKGSGTIHLEAKDVAVGDGKAKIKNAFALPRLVVGELTLTAEAKDGQIKITKLAAGGKDVELQGDGRIQMRELATDSLCDVNLRFKVNDGYRSKNDLTKSLFGAPGSNLPPLFEMDPGVKASKRSDGFYGWALRGPLGRMKPEPAGGGGGGPSSFPLPGMKGLP
jgi:type II secretion system protein N